MADEVCSSQTGSWCCTLGFPSLPVFPINTLIDIRLQRLVHDVMFQWLRYRFAYISYNAYIPESVSRSLYRLATTGPVVSAPRTSPRRLGVRFFLNAIVRSLSHRKVPSQLPSAFPSICQELTRNGDRKIGTPVIAKYPTVKCPMVRPKRYSTLQMPISGYQPQVGSDPFALINLAVRTLENDYVEQIVVSLITT